MFTINSTWFRRSIVAELMKGPRQNGEAWSGRASERGRVNKLLLYYWPQFCGTLCSHRNSIEFVVYTLYRIQDTLWVYSRINERHSPLSRLHSITAINNYIIDEWMDGWMNEKGKFNWLSFHLDDKLTLTSHQWKIGWIHIYVVEKVCVFFLSIALFLLSMFIIGQCRTDIQHFHVILSSTQNSLLPFEKKKKRKFQWPIRFQMAITAITS